MPLDVNARILEDDPGPISDAAMGVGFPERDFDGFALFGSLDGCEPFRAVKLIVFRRRFKTLAEQTTLILRRVPMVLAAGARCMSLRIRQITVTVISIQKSSFTNLHMVFLTA